MGYFLEQLYLFFIVNWDTPVLFAVLYLIVCYVHYVYEVRAEAKLIYHTWNKTALKAMIPTHWECIKRSVPRILLELPFGIMGVFFMYLAFDYFFK